MFTSTEFYTAIACFALFAACVRALYVHYINPWCVVNVQPWRLVSECSTKDKALKVRRKLINPGLVIIRLRDIPRTERVY